MKPWETFIIGVLAGVLTCAALVGLMSRPLERCDPVTQMGRGWEAARQCQSALKSAEVVLDHADTMMQKCIAELKTSCGGAQ